MLTKLIYIFISLILAALTILLVATRRQTKRLFPNKHEHLVYLIISLIALNIPVFVTTSQLNLDIAIAINYLLISVNICIAFIVFDTLAHIILIIYRHIKSKK